MESIQEGRALIQKIMDLIENHFGKHCEVVLHDLTKPPYDSTIVDIRNGHITGRKIGDCASSLGLEVVRGALDSSGHYNYITHTEDGKILRSSTAYFRNAKNEVIGTFCVNLDITESVRYETYLRDMNRYETLNGEDGEFFAKNVSELLDYFIRIAQKKVGKPVSQMRKEDKLQFLKYLDGKGALLITKSSERICEYLKISKFSLYNYLETVRRANAKEEKEK